jgi:hypothetical protein
MAIFPVYYFPPVSWFSAFASLPDPSLEQWVNYRKQQFTNRCLILGANKVQPLSIPVMRDGDHVPLCQKRISYDQLWQKDHWKGIESAYRSSPYFEYYEHDLEECFDQQPALLIDWNLLLLGKILSWMDLDVHYTLSAQYVAPSPEITDLRAAFDPKGTPAPWLKPEPYTQVFGDTFVADLSILDLVFNLGPDSKGYVVRNFDQARFLQEVKHPS